MNNSQRYHGMDGLRAFAMLMGILVHASIPYWSDLGKIAFFWPADKSQSGILWILFTAIHSWRMPLFFILAGFFAQLFLTRHNIITFLINRLHRIVAPLIIFGAITAFLLPMIWNYGFTGQFSISGFLGFPDSPGFLGHLWFLYYLCLFYAVMLVIQGLLSIVNFKVPFIRTISKGIYSPIPIVLIVLVMTALIAIHIFGKGESKWVWPINFPDLAYHGLFFLFGIGLYRRSEFIATIKTTWVFCLYLLLAACCSVAQITSTIALANPKSNEEGELIGLVILTSSSCATVLFSLGLIGLFERTLQHHIKYIRWIADSSYWIYIMHLPVVALTTFYLFRYDLAPELKFLISCAVTMAFGLITYRYLIRYTPVGWLLNGR